MNESKAKGCYVGIEVSKDTVNVYVRGNGNPVFLWIPDYYFGHDNKGIYTTTFGLMPVII